MRMRSQVVSILFHQYCIADDKQGFQSIAQVQGLIWRGGEDEVAVLCLFVAFIDVPFWPVEQTVNNTWKGVEKEAVVVKKATKSFKSPANF